MGFVTRMGPLKSGRGSWLRARSAVGPGFASSTGVCTELCDPDVTTEVPPKNPGTHARKGSLAPPHTWCRARWGQPSPSRQGKRSSRLDVSGHQQGQDPSRVFIQSQLLWAGGLPQPQVQRAPCWAPLSPPQESARLAGLLLLMCRGTASFSLRLFENKAGSREEPAQHTEGPGC